MVDCGAEPRVLLYFLSDLAKPSKEQLALQMELQRLQNARRLDVEEFDNQKQVLQDQLQSEVSHIMATEHEKVCNPPARSLTSHLLLWSISLVCNTQVVVTATFMCFLTLFFFLFL